MAYQRLDIVDGETVLVAAQISHIEDGIVENESNIAQNTTDIKQNTTDISTINTDLSNKQNALTVEAVVADGIAVSAYSYTNGSISCAKSGYTPVGLVGWQILNASSSGTGSSRCFPIRIYISGTTIQYQLGNYHASNDANLQLSCNVLYAKN